jgi:hypothetical protein
MNKRPVRPAPIREELVSGDRIIMEGRGAGSVVNNRNGYITISFDGGGVSTFHRSYLV